MPFLPAGVGAAVAGGVASAGVGLIGSALAGGKAGAGAAQAQQALTQQRNDLLPDITAGYGTLQDQQDLLGLNGPDAANAAMAKFQTSPGYQWQLGQGLRAVDAGQAAKGMFRSGATLKAEQTYGSGLADQEFGNYYNRLMGISTLGENAAAGGASTANTAGTLAQNAWNTQGSIYGNLASGLSNQVNTLFSNPAIKGLFGSGDPTAGLNNANPTVSYGGTTYGTGGQSFPSFNPSF
jgi:hypothetical protein